jgi:protein SCO1/2
MHLRRSALATLAFVAAGCGSTDSGRVVASDSVALPAAVARPSFILTDTDGKPFDFGARTAGLVTFLQFGYTKCPDICPVHAANLSTVLGKLAPSERARTVVVFVSIDPDRDSLPVLKKWLAAIDPNYIGLTGSRAALDSAQAAVGYPPAIVRAGEPGTGAGEFVNHAAPVIVFTADDSAHVMYPFGTRQADWERDMPRLLAVKRR